MPQMAIGTQRSTGTVWLFLGFKVNYRAHLVLVMFAVRRCLFSQNKTHTYPYYHVSYRLASVSLPGSEQERNIWGTYLSTAYYGHTQRVVL